MATATLHRTQEKQGTWSNVFPTEQVTGQQSGIFVKKLLAVAVSNITYLRAVFPEHAFGDRSLEDLSLKVLRDNSSCPGACQVIKWIKGCFDAIDKHYLRVLVIGIYLDPDDPDTVIESYTFKFSYAKDGGIDIYRNTKRIASAHSAVETKKATMRLLRTIVVLTQSLQSLPDDVMMTVKLLYYDDVTPADYEPPGFAAAASEIFKFEEEPMNVKVGAVATPFHSMKLRIKTDAKQFETVDDEGEGEEEKKEEMNEAEKEILQNGLDEESEVMDFQQVPVQRQAGRVKEPMEGDDAPMATPARPGVDEQAVSAAGSQSQASSVALSHDDQTVNCPCGYHEDDGLMVLCAHCKCWQHAVCFAITKEKDAPERHICSSCAKPDVPELAPTDYSLIDLPPVAVQATCLWRRALHACTETERILHTTLARRLGVEMTVASGLVNRLEKEGFLKRGRGKKLGKLVDKERLKQEGFSQYLTLQPRSQHSNSQHSNSQHSQHSNSHPSQHSYQSQDSGHKQHPKRIDDMDKLTSRAEDINITGKRKPGQKAPENPAKEVDVKKSASKKRVRARDGDDEFEVSLSQESYRIDPKKRRKASIAGKPIKI